MTAATKSLAIGRELVSPELFGKLASRIARNAQLDYDFAERVVDQTLAFLATCSRYRGRKLSPSNLVDVGWHTFILDTAEYRRFCAGSGSGRFIDHVPLDNPASGESARERVLRTVDAIREAGFEVDDELWPMNDAKCGNCQEDGNCTASGSDGNDPGAR